MCMCTHTQTQIIPKYYLKTTHSFPSPSNSRQKKKKKINSQIIHNPARKIMKKLLSKMKIIATVFRYQYVNRVNILQSLSQWDRNEQTWLDLYERTISKGGPWLPLLIDCHLFPLLVTSSISQVLPEPPPPPSSLLANSYSSDFFPASLP